MKKFRDYKNNKHWDEIYKDYGWNYVTGEYIIHCIDGDIEKE